MPIDDSEVKQIIAEFNRKFHTWGHSDTWTLGQFKILEDLIFDASHVRINANTLRRFFQQRTSSPQSATRNALCKFLGYDSYSDFVLRNAKASAPAKEEAVAAPTPLPESREKISAEKKPEQTAEPDQCPATNKSRLSKKFRAGIAIAITLVTAAIAAALWYGNSDRELDRIYFEVNTRKGTSPVTVTLNYNIPERLLPMMRVVAVESNGDSLTRQLQSPTGNMFFTFVYPGLSELKLYSGDRIVRYIPIESRKIGWQSFVKEDYSGYFGFHLLDSLYRRNGVLSLPQSTVPEKLRTDKLFITYTYYRPGLVDGDNFTVEARVRNSDDDGGISCFDTMLYAFSDTAMHGFTLNREGYSYIKFISSENKFSGENYDFTGIGFDPSEWNIMRIDVRDRHTTFSLNGKTLMSADYQQAVGMLDEITLRFKGFGAVDYIRLSDSEDNTIYFENFGME